MLTRAATTSEFDSDYFSRQYPGRRFGNRMRAAYWARWLERRVPEAGLILEVGPGLGDFASACRCPLVVSDVSLEAVDCCRTQGSVRATCASVTSLPFSSHSFDAVVVLDVLEHVEEPVSAMAEIARVLATGGRVVISVPNTSGLGARRKRERHGFTWFADADPTHKHLLSPTEWIDLAGRSGLAVLRSGSDTPWDVPYPLPVPRPAQRALAVAASALTFRLAGMLPWSFGENLVIVATKPCVSST